MSKIIYSVLIVILFSALADARPIRRIKRVSTRRAKAKTYWSPKRINGPRILITMGAHSSEKKLVKALRTGRQVIIRTKLTTSMNGPLVQRVTQKVAERIRKITYREQNTALAHRATKKENRAIAVRKPLIVYDIGLSKKEKNTQTKLNPTSFNGVLNSAVKSDAYAIKIPTKISPYAAKRELARTNRMQVKIVKDINTLIQE